jgi:hypothetical protein
VANFASNLEQHLQSVGIDVSTSAEFLPTDADLVLVQHEFGLYDSSTIAASIEQYSQPVVCFAHTAGVNLPVAGYLAMSPGMTPADMPVMVVDHPGYYVETLDRDNLKKYCGLDGFAGVISTNGFLSSNRQLSKIVEAVLPVAVARNWLVNLLVSRHATHDKHPDHQGQEKLLTWIASVSPNLRVDFCDKTHEDLNLHFQAADLLWCWTSAPSQPYASGVASDQWASGTRIITTAKQQHFALLNRDNVVWTSHYFDDFVAAVIGEIESGTPKPRHDGSPLSWQAKIEPIAKFLKSFHA